MYKNDNFGFLTFVGTSPSSLNLILCLLCNMNILCNILMILCRNVEQGTRMTTLAFLLLDLAPVLVFKFDFLSALQLKYPSQYFDDTYWKCRTGRHDVSPTRMTTLAGLEGGGYLFFVFFFKKKTFF